MTASRQLTSIRGSSATSRAACSALGEIVQRAGILQRIARRHQPPDPIELQPLQRKQADGAMRGVRRIERAAEQADAHAVRMKRDRLRGDRGHRPVIARASRAGLPGAVDAIFEAGQLLGADRPARVEFAGRDADLRAEAELAAIGELRRGVVQHDRGIDLAEEALRRSRRPR